MSKEKELRKAVLEYVLIMAAVVAAFAAVIYLFIWSGNNLIAPLVTSLTVYLDKYGRVTAEGFMLFTLAGIGLQFYDQTVRGITADFLEHIKKLDLETCGLKGSYSNKEKEVLKVTAEIEVLRTKLDSSNEKIKLLREENISHQTEIERLKNPEEVARKEQAASQKQNDESLKSIAESIRWGRT